MHQPRPALLGPAVVAQPHPVDELGLAGEVDVIGAGRGAGGDQRLAIERIGTDGADDDLGRLGDFQQPGSIRSIGDEQIGRRNARSENAGEGRADRLELAPVASDQSPAQAVRSILGEVASRQPAGKAGRAEERQVILPLRGHVPILS